MTEPTQPDAETTDVPQEAGPTPDLLLQFFAQQAQAGVIGSLKLTLSANGQLITGSVIGRDAWFDAHVAKAADDGTRTFLGGIAKAVRQNRSDDDAAHDFGYLHLTDASYAVGQGLSQGSAMIRIRIESIDSWTMGGATVR